MRGTHTAPLVIPNGPGIIPAYAGNTRMRTAIRPRAWDHPRVCGEHGWPKLIHGVNVGSSPRMRGTPARLRRSAIRKGIIPAYAGNTAMRRPPTCAPRDHPRVCGEHLDIMPGDRIQAGSSPRMRGTPPYSTVAINGDGIIPAYAGNTVRRK